MILGAVQRSLDICHTAEDHSGKPQIEDRLLKDVRPAVTSDRVPLTKMSSVESHSTSGREKERTG